MKVKIIGHTGQADAIPYWYADRIGEVFEAEPDEKQPQYFYTMIKFEGELQKHHILKVDCEELNEHLTNKALA